MAMTVRRISPTEAFTLCSDGYLLIDVRSEEEFAEGHPAGAYNVPLLHMTKEGARFPNQDFLAVMKDHFSTDARLIFTCRSGQRSLQAIGILQEAGYTNLIDQRAGFEGVRDAFGTVLEKGWKARALPICYEAELGRSYTELYEKEKG